MAEKLVVFWFRRDLRFEDNQGLLAALQTGLPVLPLFIFDKDILDNLEDKDDRRVSFLYTTIQRMQEALVQQGSTMEVRYGKPLAVFEALLNDYTVQAVYTNHDYEPYATERDGAVKKWLHKKGVTFHTFKDQVIFEKDEIAKPDGSGYTLYAPYAKKWQATLAEHHYTHAPSEQFADRFYRQPPRQLPALTEMGFVFQPSIPVIEPVSEAILQHYHKTRDTPSVQGTTRMGVHLRFGTVSVRRLLQKAIGLNEVYVRELIWREFFMQLLWHQPRLVNEACKQQYDAIVWRNNEAEFARWCRGETGYPIVDAGMRELNETGFMHNRVRMITASFLVKDLLVDWRWGEAYFARKLLDYDLAANNGNWQWVAGCGCDAAPYFRIFNPASQAKRFDPLFLYQKKWVPALASVNYPAPMVDHKLAAQRCMKVYKAALRKGEEV